MLRVSGRLLASALALVSLAGAWGCRAPSGADAIRARGHLDYLAGTIGSRPAGSAGGRAARDYIVGILRDQDFDVRLQEAWSQREDRGLSARVANVVALRQGQSDEAIALVAHYDSSPFGPGAGDDALGVAICLEAARVLAADPEPAYSLLVIVTDAEELGLMGARAAVTDPEVERRVRAFLNFDGTGAAGRVRLFQATGGAALRAWADSARPVGASFATEIYRRLPNDTDFTIFSQLDATGLNFAAVDDSYGYHTDRDAPARVQTSTIEHALDETVAIVRRLQEGPLTAAAEAPVYFDVAGVHAFVVSRGASRALATAALVVGVVAWLLLTVDGWRARGPKGLFLTAIAAACGIALAVVALLAGAALIGALRVERTPWYASPHWMIGWLVLSGIGGLWVAQLVGRRLLRRQALWDPSAAVWWLALPLWIGLAWLLTRAAPAAAYLVAVPLLAAAIVVNAARAYEGALRVGSGLVSVIALLLWAQATWSVMFFTAALFGWLSVVAPVWLYPVLLALCGLMVVPPLVALMSGWSGRARTVRVGLVIFALWLVCGAAAWTAPAYTADRPQRGEVRHIQDDVLGVSWWEVGVTEPAMSFGTPPGGVDGTSPGWDAVEGGAPASVPIGAIGKPFVWRAEATRLTDPLAAEVRATVVPAEGGQDLQIAIVPRDVMTVTIVLPPGVRPEASNHPGVFVGGRWRASLAAIPETGETVHILFASPIPNLTDARAVVTTFRASAEPSATLPSWLVTDRRTWNARSVRIVPLFDDTAEGSEPGADERPRD